ncbi:hypothetical protein HON86_02395 [Candidatus Woesearchaeota archaeon]|nr:hypothetical protein [Candidatus Woesearchaeota archaeon]MBT4835446.1 hypothetical protein [Candidatus Woesearchaeota archaeon]MBT6734862.1 hypothetical protein [Candidatus Woesearchaeota archaeon]MBT7169623.1 hypothetical protein [Candidatus Woesearchaeota archaeon]MBT7474581.1 hypothetical protein [Candidatus Woesearchaeota archaeon]
MVMPKSKGKKNNRSKKSQTFEEYSEGKDFSKKGSRNSKSRSYGRGDSKRGNSERRDSRRRDNTRIEKTTVTCDDCKEKCEVPFKPTSNKPIFCDNCFKKNKDQKDNKHIKELELINEKLDKIMVALKI